MHKIIILESEQFGNIRVFVEEGEPRLWFVTIDICRALDISERLSEEGTLVLVLCQYERGKFPITYERYDPRSKMWHDGCAQYWFPVPEEER